MTKQYEPMNTHIINSIDNSGYSDDPLTTIEEKLSFLADTFEAEYGWVLERKNYADGLTEWLQGLPSSVNIEFRDHKILELGEAWGFLAPNASEKLEDRFIEQWFSRIALRIVGLLKTYGVRG